MDFAPKTINKEGKAKTPRTASSKQEWEWLKAKLQRAPITQEMKSTSSSSCKVCAASNKSKMKWTATQTAKTLTWKVSSKVR